MERREPEDGDPLSALLHRLSNAATALPLRGDDIEVLRSPDQFFQALLDGLASAQRHISIASLYFGTGGEREAEFAAALAAAAHDPARPQLRIHLLLDALRSTRPTRGGTGVAASEKGDDGWQSSSGSGGGVGSSSLGQAQAGVGMTSTAEMLATRLLEGQALTADGLGGGSSAGERVRVSLFHTPALRGLLKRVLPPRVSEVIGVMHMKCYAFDDTVIVSGANISSTYLSTRQDRYLVLRSAPQLADFLRQVTAAVGRFSYQLLPAPGPPDAGSQQQDTPDMGHSGGQEGQQEGRQVFLPRWAAASTASGLPNHRPGQPWHSAHREPRHHHLQRHRLQRQQRYRLGPCPAGVDPVRHAPAFSQLLRQELLALFVPRPAWHAVLDFAALEAEAAQAEADAVADAAEGPAADTAAAPIAAAAAVETAAADAGVAARSHVSAPGQEADTWIVPLVQAGFAGLRQEERCTLALLSWATQQQQPAPEAGSRSSRSGSSFGGAGWGGGWGGARGRGVGTDGGDGAPAAAAPRVLLQLASPYLNLARPYERFLSRQAGSAELELLTSSPEANGFYGSKGLSGYVPLAYSLLEQRTWRRLNRRRGGGAGGAWGLPRAGWSSRHGAASAPGQHSSSSSSSRLAGWQAGAPPSWRRQLRWWEREAVLPAAASGGGTEATSPSGAPASAAAGGSSPARRLLEYCRPGWEFHAKGLWVSLPQSEQQAAGPAGSAAVDHSGQGREGCPPSWAAPAVSTVGSSNYGYRSLHRDLEVQFVLVTKNEGLRQALAAEVAGLKAHSQAVHGEAHFLAPGRRGGPIARVAVRLLRNFL